MVCIITISTVSQKVAWKNKCKITMFGDADLQITKLLLPYMGEA